MQRLYHSLGVTIAARTMLTAAGFLIFRWEKDGARVDAQMLISSELPANWRTLDEFEGADYRRVVIPAELDGKKVLANVYTAARNLRTRSEIRS